MAAAKGAHHDGGVGGGVPGQGALRRDVHREHAERRLIARQREREARLHWIRIAQGEIRMRVGAGDGHELPLRGDGVPSGDRFVDVVQESRQCFLGADLVVQDSGENPEP